MPLLSQLIALHLKNIGGDGLFFPSTKDPTGGIVLSIFSDTDLDGENKFNVTRI
ncbi:MAG: hypothetical protein ABI041_04965 [Bdellovibrionia bacterium]